VSFWIGYCILIDVLFTGWDAHCAGLDEARRREVEWREKEQVWASAPTNCADGGWGVAEGNDRWVGSDEQLFKTFYALYRGTWPSVEGGVEVTIDVHSVLEGSVDKERSACRSLYSLITFQSLTYLASYVTAPLVLLMEVVHSVVPIEELTRSSSPASMLPAALSEALGISLSDVMDRYFDGSEESERVRRIEEALDRRRTFEEGEEWLARESRKTKAMLEQIHLGQDDDSF
jgi:hypothetical protein